MGSRRRSKQLDQPPLILPSSASLDSAKLKQLYSGMLGCRMLVERTRLLRSQGVFPPDTSVATGREALEVGVLIHLVDEDCVASDGRGYVARFIRGAPPRRIFPDVCHENQAEALLGPPTGNRNVDSVLPGSTLASQMNQLTGAAWAFKLQRKPQVAVLLSSHRSSSPEWLPEAVCFSAIYKLPIVHLIDYAQGDRLHVARPDPGSRRADGASSPEGLPCFVVDRNDAVAVYRVAQEAIRRARQGHGPAFIECRAWAPPSRSSSATALTNDSFEDPLIRMETHLRSKNLWSDNWKSKLVEKFIRQLDRASATLRPLGAAPVVSSSTPTPASGKGMAKTGETNMFEAPVIRDSGRLAGGRT